MAFRFGVRAPRVIAVAIVALFATATITFAASARMAAPPSRAAVPAAAKTLALVVPQVTGEAYVFAKGVLEDGGFAWSLRRGSVGYAGYRVVSQFPAAGTRVIDTGSPTIVLRLVADPHYHAAGHTPDQGSPYAGTKIRLADDVSAVVPVVKPKAKAKVVKKTKPAATAKPAAKSVKRTAAKPGARPPAFVIAGVKREPLDEMPLPARARLLGVWVAAHQQPTAPNVQHWLYQHAWVVDGARFGWWHGAEALRTLITVDHTVERDWGFGSRSEAEAQHALTFVEAHSK